MIRHDFDFLVTFSLRLIPFTRAPDAAMIASPLFRHTLRWLLLPLFMRLSLRLPPCLLLTAPDAMTPLLRDGVACFQPPLLLRLRLC